MELLNYSANNTTIQVTVSGIKVIVVDSHLSLLVNGLSHVVVGEYINSSVSTQNTQETVIETGVIPSQYRPLGDMKAPFNQSGSIIFFKPNGNISIRTSSSGTHNVAARVTWLYR